jgi:LacI family transcriptional regulator
MSAVLNGENDDQESTFVKPLRLIVRGSSSGEGVSDPEVAEAVRFIRQHAGKPITAYDVVQHVTISRRSLERRFATALNRTIRDQIRIVRIELAKQLLVDTDLPLVAISRATGLMPLPSFHAVFKSMTGQTPSSYRSTFQRSSPSKQKLFASGEF